MRTKYFVLLRSVGNPDYCEDPTKPLPGVLSGWQVCRGPEHGAILCRRYIEENDLGSGNWAGGEVRRSLRGPAIARVSYNGRVWPVEAKGVRS